MTMLDDVLDAYGGLVRWQQTQWAQGALPHCYLHLGLLPL